LIWACVPESVSVELPFAPALIVAPPARLTVTVPLVTVKRVVERLPSTSFTLIVFGPVNVSAVSSFTVRAPGTVLTGASFTAVTSMRAMAALDVPLPSVTVTLIVRCVVEGVSVVFSNWTSSMASA
jgi:hypothetical protein